MKKTGLSVLAFAFFISCSARQVRQNLCLWYNHPAKNWLESVPLGNGRLGAMPDGGIVNEDIVLNDITLWSGGPQDADREDAVKYLPEIQKLIFEGENAEAQTLVNKTFICKGKGSGHGSGANDPFGSYQILGDLHLQYNYGMNTRLVKPLHYFRELSLDSAIARCDYEINAITYHREYFTSFSDDVIIIRLAANQPGKINVKLSLDRPERYKTVVHGNELDMSGQLNNGMGGKGMQYMVRIKMKQDGGRLLAGDSTLQLTDANSVVIYVSAVTDFNHTLFKDKSSSLLQAAMNKPYDKELASHITTYQTLFQRSSLFLRNENLKNAALPTDERLVAFAKDPTDNGVPVLFFEYGRYLLISSTRPGLLPPNLQGLWANTTQTPWNGDYHLDINIEMNHWPLEVTNLPMLNQPFYKLVKNMVKRGGQTAKAYYNAGGWVAYTITNIWGYTSPGEDASWGMAVSGSGWMCHVLWSHYVSTQDTVYLRKIYPIIKGAAEFYLNSLVKDPDNGWLVTAPSNSPENGFRLIDGKTAQICAGPTIDNQVIRELFTDVISASHILRTDETFSKKLEYTRKKLPPNTVDKRGRLMEWLKPYEEIEPHHRHMSPVWALYPGNEISEDTTPILAEAAKALIKHRGDSGPEWSLAWKINLWARLGDGNQALSLLEDLLNPILPEGEKSLPNEHIYPNLFCGPPFQIDGNFGTCAGIAEMLIQSQDGYIQLLPALPDRWHSGIFKGLCVRGGGEVSAHWENNRIQSAEIIATVNNQFKVKIPDYISAVKLQHNNEATILKPSNGFISIFLHKGEMAKLTF